MLASPASARLASLFLEDKPPLTVHWLRFFLQRQANHSNFAGRADSVLLEAAWNGPPWQQHTFSPLPPPAEAWLPEPHVFLWKAARPIDLGPWQRVLWQW